MALADEVKNRHGGATSQRLIQLTNDDPTATTINATVLDAACVDAEGLFEDIVGVQADITQKNHLYILVQAVIAFLENYKSRDSNILTQRWKNVIGSMKGMRSRGYILPETNSVLTPGEETSGVCQIWIEINQFGRIQKAELQK